LRSRIEDIKSGNYQIVSKGYTQIKKWALLLNRNVAKGNTFREQFSKLMERLNFLNIKLFPKETI